MVSIDEAETSGVNAIRPTPWLTIVLTIEYFHLKRSWKDASSSWTDFTFIPIWINTVKNLGIKLIFKTKRCV